jgi:GxxExxY protein
MIQSKTKLLHPQLSHRILDIAFQVHNILGPGLLDRCYQEAYCLELRAAGVYFESQKNIEVIYRDIKIGEYIADIVVDEKIILELKSVNEFHPTMEAQIINYLRLSKCQVGYLINFNRPSVEWKRFVLEVKSPTLSPNYPYPRHPRHP